MDNIIELNPFAIAIFDKEGSYVKVNHAFLKIFKNDQQKDNTLIKNLVLIAQNPLEEIVKLKKGEIVSYPGRDYNPHNHDEEFPDLDLALRIINYPLMNENNQLEYVVSITQNITDLKQTQEELEANIQRSSIISMISSILIHDITKMDENLHSCLCTLGRALNANYCSILQHIQNDSEIEFKSKCI